MKPVARQNLRKLALYLLSLPEDYNNFTMTSFYKVPSWSSLMGWLAVGPKQVRLEDCGAVACALGHGPAAGISVKDYGSWQDYCYGEFGLDWYGKEAGWCFSTNWSKTDNTPQGAGKRILSLLEEGLPHNWEEQMNGSDPLSYLDFTQGEQF